MLTANLQTDRQAGSAREVWSLRGGSGLLACRCADRTRRKARFPLGWPNLFAVQPSETTQGELSWHQGALLADEPHHLRPIFQRVLELALTASL